LEKKKEKLDVHVGGHNSTHNQAWSKFEALRNQKQHIEHALMKQTDQALRAHKVRLNASINCARFLLRQGIAFRGDDETENSSNQGNKARGRSRRGVQNPTNMHYFRVDLFYSVIDMQLQELNDRFTEANTELLLCVTCLCPNDLFCGYDKQKLIRLAQIYQEDFSPIELLKLEDQLETYILDVRSNENFDRLQGLGDLAKKMVETKKDKVYPLVFLLITLALILPVATATVERAFSSMNFVKNRLRNRMGDRFMNDNLIVYVEKEISDSIDNEVIIERFQLMKTRRIQL